MLFCTGGGSWERVPGENQLGEHTISTKARHILNDIFKGCSQLQLKMYEETEGFKSLQYGQTLMRYACPHCASKNHRTQCWEIALVGLFNLEEELPCCTCTVRKVLVNWLVVACRSCPTAGFNHIQLTTADWTSNMFDLLPTLRFLIGWWLSEVNGPKKGKIRTVPACL